MKVLFVVFDAFYVVQSEKCAAEMPLIIISSVQMQM